jgi:hypothetical protein
MTRYVVLIVETSECIGPFATYELAAAYKNRMITIYDCKILTLEPTRIMRMA